MDGHIGSIGSQFVGNSTATANFASWINTLTNKGKTMPDRSNHPDFMDKYQEFLDDYSKFGPSEYRSPAVDLYPQAL